MLKVYLDLVFIIKTTKKTDFKKFGFVMIISKKYTNVETVKSKDFTRNSMRMDTLKLKLLIKITEKKDFKNCSMKTV
jgi:hypothetical protein